MSSESQSHRNTGVCVQEGMGAEVLTDSFQQTPQGPRERARDHQENLTLPVTPTPASDTHPLTSKTWSLQTKSNRYSTQVRKVAPFPETREACSSRKEGAKLLL